MTLLTSGNWPSATPAGVIGESDGRRSGRIGCSAKPLLSGVGSSAALGAVEILISVGRYKTYFLRSSALRRRSAAFSIRPYALMKAEQCIDNFRN